jgi:hypothetical protein
MTCETCGAQLKPGTRFCGGCGSAVAERPARTEAAGASIDAPAAVAVSRSAPSWATPRVIAGAAALVIVLGVGIPIAVAATAGQNGGTGTVVDDGGEEPVAEGDPQEPDAPATSTDPGTNPAVETPLPPSQPVDPADYRVSSWAEGVWFISPSGNLSCGIGDDLWGCAIRERDWQFPSSSPGDFCYQSEISCGDGIAVRVGENGDLPAPLQRGGAEFPDEAGLAVSYLQYGQSVTYGTVTCASTFENVVCADTSSGHGFVISRNENRIF